MTQSRQGRKEGRSRSSRAGAAWRELSARLDETFGPTTLFLRAVVIPQLFVVIFLLVLGAILVQGVDSFLLRLGTLGVLFGSGLYAARSREYVSYRLIVVHMLGLVAFVVGASVLVLVEPLTHVYLPVIGLTAPLLALALPPLIGATVVAGIAFLVVVYTPLALAEWGVGSAVLSGLSGVALMGGLVIGRARMRRPEMRGRSGPGFERGAGAGGKPVERPLMQSDERAIERDLQTLWNRTVLGEFLGEVLWKLVAAWIVVGGLVCAGLLTVGPFQPLLALSWVALAAIQVTLLVQILQGREFEQVARSALLGAVVVVGWWEVAVPGPAASGFFPELMLALIIIWLVPLPWSRPHRLTLCGVIVLGAVVRGLQCPSPAGLAVGLGLVLPLVLRLSAIAHLHLAMRAALHFLRRVGEGSPTALVACRALGWQLGRVVEATRVLLLVGERRMEVLEGGISRASSVDPVFGQGLFEVLRGYRDEEGILPFTELSAQFVSPCVDWFGEVPTSFYFVRVFAIIDEREEEIVIVVPGTATARSCGHSRVVRACGGLAALVRGWLAAARGRFLSSDVIFASQQSISAREEDLNQLVHLVNNVAQDISAECDEMRETVRSGDTGGAEIEGRIQRIERVVHGLSAGVSDVKLLKELLRVRVLRTNDSVELGSLLDDVAGFGRYRSARSGRSFRVEREPDVTPRVSVASRDFLAMVLRMLVRLAESRSPSGAEIVMQVRQVEGAVHLVVVDSGSPPDRDLIEREITRRDEMFSGDRALESYRAAHHLATLSGGRFVLEEVAAGWAAVLVLKPAAEQTGDTAVGGWVLLVDDNPQVTNFYARVAEALQQRYFTAASVREAQEILDREGRPRLVVTDLQLGEASGIELLREVRRRFDENLPIIVVSGDTGGDVAEKVRAAGATSYLAKPVGRSRLLAELQGLLRS